MKHDAKIAAEVDMRLDAGSLKKAVKLCRHVITRKHTIPILGFLRLKAEADGSIWAAGTNLDTEVKAALSGSGSGDCTLPARTLGEFLAGAGLTTDDEVTIRTDGERIAIRAGGMTLRLAPLPVEDWPAMKMPTKQGSRVTFPEGTLPWLLNYVRPAISTEEARYYLNGIFLTGGAEGIRAVATDGHRLAARLLRLDASAPEFAEIVPRTMLAVLLDAAGPGEVDAEIWAHKPKEEGVPPIMPRARFSGADWAISTKLIDGTFPDWKRILPTEEAPRLTLDGKQARRFVRASKAIAQQCGFRAVKIEKPKGGAACLSANDPSEGAVAMDVTAAATIGFPDAVGFNRLYLQDALDAAGSGNDLTICMADNGSPMRIVPPNDTDIFVVMPMRF